MSKFWFDKPLSQPKQNLVIFVVMKRYSPRKCLFWFVWEMSLFSLSFFKDIFVDIKLWDSSHLIPHHCFAVVQRYHSTVFLPTQFNVTLRFKFDRFHVTSQFFPLYSTLSFYLFKRLNYSVNLLLCVSLCVRPMGYAYSLAHM